VASGVIAGLAEADVDVGATGAAGAAGAAGVSSQERYGGSADRVGQGLVGEGVVSGRGSWNMRWDSVAGGLVDCHQSMPGD
jgi:hypothetical protein